MDEKTLWSAKLAYNVEEIVEIGQKFVNNHNNNSIAQ